VGIAADRVHRGMRHPSQHAAWKTIPSLYFISSGDQIITTTSEMAMAKRAHSRITLSRGGSHLTLISHPDAVTEVISAAIDSPALTPRNGSEPLMTWVYRRVKLRGDTRRPGRSNW